MVTAAPSLARRVSKGRCPDIGTAHKVAFFKQDQSQGAHAVAANTDKVDLFDLWWQQMLLLFAGGVRHSYRLLNILKRKLKYIFSNAMFTAFNFGLYHIHYRRS
jgi:hypothetical protein